jgi:hypothetical protein
MTSKEWEEYKNILNAYAQNASDGGNDVVTLTGEVVKQNPGMTQGEAEDVAKVIYNSRSSNTVPIDVPGSLNKLSGEAGGSLTTIELQKMLSGVLGVVTLGPLAFKLGTTIGNGIDQIFGFPTWEEFLNGEGTPSGGGYGLRSCQAPEELKAEAKLKYLCPGAPGGTFVAYRGGFEWVEDEWTSGPETGKKYPFIGPLGAKGAGVSAETMYGTERYVERGGAFEICHGKVVEGHCEVPTEIIKEPYVKPTTVPMPLPTEVQKKQEEENKEHKVGWLTIPNPHKTNLTDRQLNNWIPHSTTCPGTNTCSTVSKATLEENAPQGGSGLSAGPDESAGSKYVKENLENAKNYPSENPVEPPPGEGPIFNAPTTSLKIPKFGVACTTFPFGVPCWVVKTIESWSSTGTAPTLTVPIGGHSLVAKLSAIEPAMEVVRPVFAIAAIVGLVMTFFSFAMGGSGGSGGGSDD